MLIKLFVLSCVLLVFSTAILADNSCPKSSSKDKATKDIDLRLEMGPLRDQDSIGWCYGFSAADLLTHYLYKTRAKEVYRPDRNADYRGHQYAVSAVGLSTFLNKTEHGNFLKGVIVKNADELALKYKKKVVYESGTIFEALTAAKKRGFCFEKDLPSENFGYVQDQRCAQKNKCQLEEMLKIVFDEAGTNSCNSFPKIQKLFPTLTVQTINKVLLFTEKENAIERLANVACQKKFSTHFFGEDQPVIINQALNDPSSAAYKPNFKNRTALELLDNAEEALNKGTPAGILYYANFLLSPTAKQGSPHASTLVGKRFNSRTCEVEYILRNSWGRSCDIYNTENPNYTKCVSTARSLTDAKDIFLKMHACRGDFPPVSRNPNVHCDSDSGYAYIRKTDLLKNVFGMNYLQE